MPAFIHYCCEYKGKDNNDQPSSKLGQCTTVSGVTSKLGMNICLSFADRAEVESTVL